MTDTYRILTLAYEGVNEKISARNLPSATPESKEIGEDEEAEIEVGPVKKLRK